MPEAAALQAIIERLSLLTGLGWAVIAFARGWIVPRSVHDQLKTDRDSWVTRHDKIAAIAEQALRMRVGGGA